MHKGPHILQTEDIKLTRQAKERFTFTYIDNNIKLGTLPC